MKHHLTLTLVASALVLTAHNISNAAPRKGAASAITQMSMTQFNGANKQTHVAATVYKLTLRRDGTAIYVGDGSFKNMRGRYAGKVSAAHFTKLANLMSSRSFQQWGKSNRTGDLRRFASARFEKVSGAHKESVLVYDYDVSYSKQAHHSWGTFWGLLFQINWQKASD